MFIPENLITGFSLENQEGNTAVSCCRNMHVNVTGLTVKRHISFARDIVLKLLLNEQSHRKEDGYQHFIKRYSEQKQLELIDKWIEQGKISFEDLKEKQKEALQKYRNKLKAVG